MTKDLLVRGFDDEIHSKLGEIAKRDGVSLNSIVKDAVDKWINQNKNVPHRHDLILYGDDSSMVNLLKSMNNLAETGEWFRSHCGPPDHKAVQLLDKLKWFNGTVKPYNIKQKSVDKYCGKAMSNIAKAANKKEVCCMDFILGDVARNDFKLAVSIEKMYNKDRAPGLMFCPYKMESLLKMGISDMMELFDQHDQIFIVKNDELHKMHVTKESTHKLFLN